MDILEEDEEDAPVLAPAAAPAPAPAPAPAAPANKQVVEIEYGAGTTFEHRNATPRGEEYTAAGVVRNSHPFLEERRGVIPVRRWHYTVEWTDATSKRPFAATRAKASEVVGI